MPSDTLLEMRHIVKKYPGVVALKGVDFLVRRHSVHCLVGENGAGKSTLIKILTCAERMTEGEIVFDGKAFAGRSVRDAMDRGISTVFQELNVVEQLTVEENMTLGREKSRAGLILRDPLDPVLAMLKEFAPDIPLQKPVALLSFAEKQIVEIVKAAGTDAKLVIMDEPTAALSRVETERLYAAIRRLKRKGLSVIYISHALDDIFAVGDEVTVLRDGEAVGTKAVQETTREELVRMMIGRPIHGGYCPGAPRGGEPLLSVRDLGTRQVRGVSFELQAGEILGFYGLRGAGKSEVARALMGMDRLLSGEVLVEGKRARLKNPGQAFAGGLAMVPEERLTEGLFLKLPVADNIAVTNLRQTSRLGIVNEKADRRAALGYIRSLNIKAHSLDQKAATLSGGNQQKVVIAKCLNARTKILLLDEPSRGIDVGSKEEIYGIIRRLAAQGVGVIVFSSEYEEIAALCDRVALMADGAVVTIVRHGELDPHGVHMQVMGKGALE